MDINWKSPEGVFSVRAGAIVRDGDQILLCTTDGLDGWFMPGGRVKLGETAVDAVVRELREEMQLELIAGELMLVTEDRVMLKGVLHHEICFYYAVPWPPDLSPEAALQNPEDEHTFRWVPLAALRELPILPPQLRDYLLQDATGLRHLSIDRTASGG